MIESANVSIFSEKFCMNFAQKLLNMLGFRHFAGQLWPNRTQTRWIPLFFNAMRQIYLVDWKKMRNFVGFLTATGSGSCPSGGCARRYNL